MTNNSYYDDMYLVKEILDRVVEFKDENEMLYEGYNNVKNLVEVFEEVIEIYNPTSEEFDKAYDNLTEGYMALETLFTNYDKELKSKSRARKKVGSIAFSIFDPRSSIIKYRLFLNTNVITPEYVKVIRRLVEESKTIGFYLSMEEKGILLNIDNYISSIV